MIKYENDCVSCALPCTGFRCPNFCVPHYYCDKCGMEAENLFQYDNEELCQDCLLEIIPVVNSEF